MGVYYGYCLKCQKSKRVTRYGLILISVAKNILIFFVLGSMLGINVYQEGLEIYQWITSFIPFYQSLISPEISFILLWLLVFVSEAYIVIIYSGFIISKLMKRK